MLLVSSILTQVFTSTKPYWVSVLGGYSQKPYKWGFLGIF